MSRAATRPVVTIRPFAHGDQAAVLELLTATLGGGPAGQHPASFFCWKHFDNPFGASFMLVAEADGQVIGLRAFLRWTLHGPGGPVVAVRAVDTATHPSFQGMGVFSRLTRLALEQLVGEADLVFNTPNNASRPGYLKLGWLDAGRVPVAIRVRRPISFAQGLRRTSPSVSPPKVDATPAAQALDQGEEVTRLLAEIPADRRRLHTRRDVRYLRWRYGAAPLLDYRAVVEREAGRLRGMALFRVRPRGGLWEATVAEVLVPPDDRRIARRLLRGVAKAAAVDHLAIHVPAGGLSSAGAARAAFLPAPGGISFVVRPLRPDLDPDPTDLRSWSLTLGDLEVF